MATKKKIAQPKRGTKRAAEKPVDQEIRRAAARAGISAPASPDPVSAPAGTAETHVDALADAIIESITRSTLAPFAKRRQMERLMKRLGDAADAVDDDHSRQVAKRHDDEYLSNLSRLVSGGLWVDDNEPGIMAESALLHGTGALVKAITLSLHPSHSGEDWDLDGDEMLTDEIAVALSVVTTLLQAARPVLSHLRASDQFRSSGDRPSKSAEGGAT